MQLEKIAVEFQRTLPHTKKPFSSRLWGHKFHSLCSYQGKLKPSLAHWLIKEFSSEGDTILDPLGGVGTIAFEANQLGRIGWSNDKSPFASTIAHAKLAPSTKTEVDIAFRNFANFIANHEPTELERDSAEFGLNAKVKDYFHPNTLDQILVARRWAREVHSESDIFLKANLLHILHGNRPYALSRTSHPITPFAPSGLATNKSVSGKVRERLDKLDAHWDLLVRTRAISLNGDFRSLPNQLPGPCTAIITSPPFPGMRFDRPNWMRMWFCGWEEHDFHLQSKSFLERQQGRNFDVYLEFFDIAASLLSPGAPLLLHVGGSKAYDMIERLKTLASGNFDYRHTIDEDVSQIEKHGILDKGLTSRHLILVLSRKV